jgi:hypothetical protein
MVVLSLLSFVLSGRMIGSVVASVPLTFWLAGGVGGTTLPTTCAAVVGTMVGFGLGTVVGSTVGFVVGPRKIDDTPLAKTVGTVLGRKVVGSELGVLLGDREGVPNGDAVGDGLEGTRLGIMDGTKDDGTPLAISDGLSLGCWFGVLLGDGEGSQLETWLGNHEGAELG